MASEIENLYKKLTKEYFKQHTGDFEAFKKVFGGWVNKIQEKLPTSYLKRVHNRSEAKENTFSMKNVAELDKQVRSQKSAKRKKHGFGEMKKASGRVPFCFGYKEYLGGLLGLNLTCTVVGI